MGFLCLRKNAERRDDSHFSVDPFQIPLNQLVAGFCWALYKVWSNFVKRHPPFTRGTVGQWEASLKVIFWVPNFEAKTPFLLVDL